MKLIRFTLFVTLLGLLAGRGGNLLGQATAFTYQGHFSTNGSPYTGTAEFQFTLWDAATDGGQVAATTPTSVIVGVTNGLFDISLDFGAAAFPGADRWLQIEVRTTAGSFTTLAPRQKITTVPYATRAGSVQTNGLPGGIYGSAVTFNNAANSFSGTFAGNGAGLTGLNAANLASGTVPDARLSGNLARLNVSQTFSGANTFSGASTFNHPGNNFTGNGSGLTGLNATSLASGTVADARIAATIARDSEVLPLVLAGDGTGSGLDADLLDGLSSAALWQLGGNAGTTPGTHFLGTTDNQPLELKVNGARVLRLEPSATSPNVIGGFNGNFVRAGDLGSTIGGGGSVNSSNAIYGDYATIAGGRNNDIGTNSDYGVIGGGLNNNITASSPAATIAGGSGNGIGTNSDYSAIGGGLNNNIATNAPDATIAGGRDSGIGAYSSASAIGGGFGNSIATNSPDATIAGGRSNAIGINSDSSAIGGGFGNGIAASSRAATVAGGSGNDIGTNSDYSAIGGGGANHIGAHSSYAIIVGGFVNEIGTNSLSSAIGGGGFHSIANNSFYGTIAGGYFNVIGDRTGTGAIGGGQNNSIANGAQNATIPGGEFNTVSGDYGFAAGRRANALFPGSFVWADSQNADFTSQFPDSVNFRCQGGVRFTSGDTGANQTVLWLPGFASWSFSSDRNLKEAVSPVNTREVLDKVSRLPVKEWNFKGYAQRHIGPMAQDFHEQFPFNDNDRMIDSGDLHGVALAAIQGLNEKVEVRSARAEGCLQELREELKRRDAENAELKRRLEKLEHVLHSLARTVTPER